MSQRKDAVYYLLLVLVLCLSAALSAFVWQTGLGPESFASAPAFNNEGGAGTDKGLSAATIQGWALKLLFGIEPDRPEGMLFSLLPVPKGGTDGIIYDESRHRSSVIWEGEDYDPNVKDTGPQTPSSAGTGKAKILIYHTHTNEAYEQTAPAYSETGKWRTDDQSFNIVRVGTELCTYLSRDYGWSVIHDTTDHVQGQLSTAYSRSLLTMRSYQSTDADVKYYIDVHRDAYFPSVDGDTTIEIDGRRVAKMVLVVGTAEGDGSTTYDSKPDWQHNLKIAQRITDELNRIKPGLCKPVIVRKERFNQHVAKGCLLIEVGHNKNTLDEAEAATEYLARALARVL